MMAKAMVRCDRPGGAQPVQCKAGQTTTMLPMVTIPTGWRHQKTQAAASPSITPQRPACSWRMTLSKAYSDRAWNISA